MSSPLAAITHQCPSKLTLHLRVCRQAPWGHDILWPVALSCLFAAHRGDVENGNFFFIVMTHICLGEIETLLISR